jgi:hypothetical protein
MLTVRLRMMTSCFLAARMASTIVRPRWPVPPATATVTILISRSFWSRSTIMYPCVELKSSVMIQIEGKSVLNLSYIYNSRDKPLCSMVEMSAKSNSSRAEERSCSRQLLDVFVMRNNFTSLVVYLREY